MCHITIITYHIKHNIALQCGNWKQQQRVILLMSAYQKQEENSDFEFISVSFSAVKAVIYVTNIQVR